MNACFSLFPMESETLSFLRSLSCRTGWLKMGLSTQYLWAAARISFSSAWSIVFWNYSSTAGDKHFLSATKGENDKLFQMLKFYWWKFLSISAFCGIASSSEDFSTPQSTEHRAQCRVGTNKWHEITISEIHTRLISSQSNKWAMCIL